MNVKTKDQEYSKHGQQIWEELWPYIASEDPPDSGDTEKDLLDLMEGVLPRVWNHVGKLEAENLRLREMFGNSSRGESEDEENLKMNNRLHECLDKQHTDVLLKNYSGSYQDWLEEEIEALWRYVRELHYPALPTEINESTQEAHQALSTITQKMIDPT